LNSKIREENSDKNNAEILGYLIKGGREFTSIDINNDRELISAVSSEMKKTILEQIDKYPNLKKESDRIAKQIMAKALMKGMEIAKKIISERISSGKNKDGSAVKDLSLKYADYKEKTYGHKYPIGVATGQLLDNLGPGARNVRLRRS